VSGIERVGRCRPDASVDIIFVHGLGGNWRTTWEFLLQPTKLKFDPRPESRINPTANAEPATWVEANALFWPEWIADSVPTAAVWALDYEANRSDWSPGMALSQHGEQALAILAASGFGKRPIVFIAHSLGGLVVKSLLQASYDDLGAANRTIAQATRGVVFFATPNSGSRLATRIAWLVAMLGPIGQLARLSELVRVLRANEPELLKLNRWYRDRVTDMTPKGLKISTQAFYETRPIFLGLISIVDASSADPGIGGVRPIPIAEDHFAICKLSNPDHWIFKSVVNFVSACLQSDACAGGGPIIELVLPPNAQSIRLVFDDNMIPNGNLTFRVTRSDGAKT
jgi:pimeloyl-ACP methyl ester carboxylesterase